MPTRDRRPRRRVKPQGSALSGELQSLFEEARNAAPADWEGGLRRRFIRYLVDSRGQKPEIASGIVRAYEKRPELIPMRPPRSIA